MISGMEGTEAAIRTEHLTKNYGRKRGITDVNLEVRPGEVFGYLGPNGAGKTTTIRLLLNFLQPSQGRAEIFGHDVVSESIRVRKKTGYLPGDLKLYENLTGGELLDFLARLRGEAYKKHTLKLCERLQCELSVKIQTLSHGNKQKIGLVQAFMHQPELVILDEPTSGLDPLIQQEFYSLVAEVKDEGRTVFLSTHILPEAERICDRVGIIRHGKLAAIENVSQLKARALRKLQIHFAEPVSVEDFASVEGVQDVQVEDSILECSIVGELDTLIKTASKYHVINIISREPSLEEVFLTYYGNGENGDV